MSKLEISIILNSEAKVASSGSSEAAEIKNWIEPNYYTIRRAVVRMVERGEASPQDIDTALRLGAGHAVGPIELMDIIGLDVCNFILDGWSEKYPQEKLFRSNPKISSRSWFLKTLRLDLTRSLSKAESELGSTKIVLRSLKNQKLVLKTP